MGVMLSSLTDAARPIAVHGLRAAMREALPALVSGVRAAKIARQDARDLGAVTEVVLQGRLAEQLVFSTSLGMMVAWLKFMERGDTDEAERLLDNPGLWIADGLDRTGILSLPFEISNTAEKWNLPVGLKTGAQALAGDKDRAGTVSRFANRGKVGAVAGPSFSLFEDLGNIAEALSRGDLKKSDANAIIRQLPGGTLPGLRTAIHVGVKPELQDAVDE